MDDLGGTPTSGTPKYILIIGTHNYIFIYIQRKILQEINRGIYLCLKSW